MMTQVYDLKTVFNFGKYRGKTLEQVLKSGEARYVGYLIFMEMKRFVLHPDTVSELDKHGFFDDMPISYYGPTGSLSTKSLVDYDKNKFLKKLKMQYQDYTNDPNEYERIVKQEVQEYYNNKKERTNTETIEPNNDNDYGTSYEKYGGYNGYSDDVIDDAFDGDPTATWNVE
ncbi:hypothetical protein [Carboxylicivirga taeanensis]|uniref:hypothetical protein n=1 Tax=Carboxylicivirga taeanensis TaxID=1416875 RepID=UPI003F6E0035